MHYVYSVYTYYTVVLLRYTAAGQGKNEYTVQLK